MASNHWQLFDEDSDIVTRLLAAYGTIQGTFPVDNGPSSLVYDGTCIWVGTIVGSTVTRIRLSDWPLENQAK